MQSRVSKKQIRPQVSTPPPLRSKGRPHGDALQVQGPVGVPRGAHWIRRLGGIQAQDTISLAVEAKGEASEHKGEP